MDKEIKDIARILCQDSKGELLCTEGLCESTIECAYMQKAERLMKIGYGNIKHVLEEFSEKLREKLETYYGFGGQDLEDMTLDGTEVQEAILEVFEEMTDK